MVAMSSGFILFFNSSTLSWLEVSSPIFKKEFQPITEYEDYLIEDILQRSFQDGDLEKQPPAIYVPILDLLDIWKGYDDSDYDG